jgi:hypothetical protein
MGGPIGESAGCARPRCGALRYAVTVSLTAAQCDSPIPSMSYASTWPPDACLPIHVREDGRSVQPGQVFEADEPHWVALFGVDDLLHDQHAIMMVERPIAAP